MTARMQVRMLGPPLITVDGERCDLPTRKAEALLHYLILRPGEHNRSTLALLLWPDHNNPRQRLSHALDQLRRALACPVDPEFGKRFISATRDTLTFSPQPDLYVDSTELLYLLDQVGKAPYLGPQEREYLCQAIELYGGMLLENFFLEGDCADFNDWLVREQYEMEQRYLSALRALALYDASQGAYPQAIRWFRRYLDTERYDESIHCLLMLLQVVNGEPHQALNHYELHRDVFQERASLALAVSATRLSHLISSGALDDRALAQSVNMVLPEIMFDTPPSLTDVVNGILHRLDADTCLVESEQVLRAIHQAKQLACELGFSYFGAPHLFLALIAQRDRPTMQLLSRLGLRRDDVQHSLLRVLGLGQAGPEREMNPSPYCRFLLDRTWYRARQDAAEEVQTNHLLEVILEDRRGPVLRLLEKLCAGPLNPGRYITGH